MTRAKARSKDKRKSFLKSLPARKPQSRSHSASPAYHCTSSLMFCVRLVFRPIRGIGNHEMVDDGETSSRVTLFFFFPGARPAACRVLILVGCFNGEGLPLLPASNLQARP